MTNERFNELLRGPLSHPLWPFQTTRLILALRCLVEAGGPEAEDALETFCQAMEARDKEKCSDEAI